MIKKKRKKITSIFTGNRNDKEKKLNSHDSKLSSVFMVAYQDSLCRNDIDIVI
jgi:hypothetical protein